MAHGAMSKSSVPSDIDRQILSEDGAGEYVNQAARIWGHWLTSNEERPVKVDFLERWSPKTVMRLSIDIYTIHSHPFTLIV